jgi:hypothetical protein
MSFRSPMLSESLAMASEGSDESSHNKADQHENALGVSNRFDYGYQIDDDENGVMESPEKQSQAKNFSDCRRSNNSILEQMEAELIPSAIIAIGGPEDRSSWIKSDDGN